MAQCYPKELPNDFGADPRRSGDIKVYRALDEQLPGKWVVFYSVAWLGKTSLVGQPRDGEADFVVAHPEHGILILEVKGGGIRYDGELSKWFSTDRHGVEHEIKDPFRQCTAAKGALLRKLRSLPRWRDQWVPCGHAVVFPDVLRQAVEQAPLPVHADRAIILTREDLDQMTGRLRAVYQFWKQSPIPTRQQGDDLVNELVRLLAPVTVLPNPMRLQIEQDETEMLRLTRRQFMAIDLLSRKRRVALCGCAGSGKTMLAVEKARRLAREGFRALLTCASEPLQRYLEELTAPIRRDGDLEVRTFEQLCRHMAREAGLPWQEALSGPGGDETRQLRHPMILEEAMTKKPELGFDAILVDEGQDFHELWWGTMEKCLRERREGILYVFYDDNQRVYPNRGLIPSDLDIFRLPENVRNTRAIHNCLMRYYRGDGESLPARDAGRTIEKIACADAGALKKQLAHVLRRLLIAESVSPEKIVVLTPKPLETSKLPGMQFADNVRLVTEAAKGRDILCASVASFKGLERWVVIVAELERESGIDDNQWTALCYVAFSRPCHHLISTVGVALRQAQG